MLGGRENTPHPVGYRDALVLMGKAGRNETQVDRPSLADCIDASHQSHLEEQPSKQSYAHKVKLLQAELEPKRQRHVGWRH